MRIGPHTPTIIDTLTGEPWQTLAELNPDGTVSVYTYTNVTGSGGTFQTNVVSSGASSWSWGQIFANSTWGNWPPVADGMTTMTVVDQWGQTVLSQVQDIASGILTDQRIYSNPDALDRYQNVAYLDSTSESFTYACCGLATSTDRDGVTSSYTYDAAKRLVATSRVGITTTNVLDAAGHVLQTIRLGTDGSPIQLSGAAYDTDGSVIRQTNALGGVTLIAQGTNSLGETVITNTAPDGGTIITTNYQDGSTLGVAGTAALPVKYLYGVDGSGPFTTQVKVTSTGGTNEWVKTSSDMLGRAYKTTYAPGTPSATTYYNRLGQRSSIVDPDGVTNLFQYTAKGELAYTAIDLNGDGAINFGGTDRITFVTNDVTLDNSANVRRSRTYVWSTNSNGSSNLISTVETSCDGLKSWNTVWNNGVGATSKTVTYYAGGANNSRYLTNTAPDGSYTITLYTNTRLASVTRYDANQSQILKTSYGYDPHGRQSAVIDARTGTTTYGFNNADQISTITTPPPTEVTTYYFDGMGRIIGTALPDSTSVSNVFNPTGLPALTYGSRTYPVGYTYDSQGRMKTMTTWTSFAGQTGTRVTTWNYDQYRGWLSGKVYPDGTGPTYTNTPAGRLGLRVWARGTNTVYSYNAAGDLSGITYNDGTTPNVTYGYDRRGRQTSVTQGSITTSRSFDDAGNLLAESYSGGPLGGLSMTNAFDSLVRRTAVALSNQTSTLVKFGYDAASRLSVVTNGTATASYSYLANSPLVSQINFANGGSPLVTVSKSYDNLNRITSVSAGTTINYNYGYNLANQRIAVTNGDNTYFQYGYDALGQVTSGSKRSSDGTLQAGEQFQYAFDDIGNRQTTAAGGDQFGGKLRYANYAVNNLNQYTSRTVPGTVDVIGTANASATVTVNNQAGSRKGTYYDVPVALNNATNAVWASLTNLAVLNNGTNLDITTNWVGNVFLPQTPESFHYDRDGNLTNDGRWNYTWDGENRLVSMQGLSTLPAGARLKLDFVYDDQGRRIQKAVSVWTNSAWSLTLSNRFVYDGWNLVAVLNATNNNLIRSFAWGLDLSGTVQGAGGVGGLVMGNDAVYGEYFVVSDANGNVGALWRVADSWWDAQYEYGPFGELLRATGPMAKASPFRFSTKYQDDETDLLYYGYRHLNTSTGRWLSRDPSREGGGANLYEAMGNDPSKYLDRLGDNFIAVGSRHLVIPLPSLEHMSIEYYKEPCLGTVTEGTRFKDPVEVGVPGPADFYQLNADLFDFGHYVWVRPKPTEPPERSFVADMISYVEKVSTATRRIVIYSDATSGGAEAAWDRIKGAASSYAYAERFPLPDKLERWPNSWYLMPWQPPGNNSNTFVREMARVIGRNADVIGGNHPGALYAQAVPYPGYTPSRHYNQ